MKKISLIVLLVITTVTNATPENGFYIGANVGVSVSANKTVYENLAEKYHLEYKFKNNDITYGLHTGYKFNPYFATELSVGHLGKFNIEDKNNNNLYYKYNHDAAFALAKVIFPAADNIDLYAKAGIGVIRTKYTEGYENYAAAPSGGAGIPGGISTPNKVAKELSFTQTGKNTYSVPVAVGAEFAITDNLTANLEYQYIHHVHHNLAAKVDDEEKIPAEKKEAFKKYLNDFKPSMHSAKVGLTYYFGTKKVKAPLPAEEAKPITLASEALFKFGSAQFSGNGIKIINELAEQIKQEQIENQSVVVAGHTDRLGSAQFNLKLSEKRAGAIAEQLIANGVSNVAYIGYGFERSITGEQCANVKGRQALIECYAPDRRVEIQITGQK